MILILCSSGACLVLGMSGRKNSLRSAPLDDSLTPLCLCLVLFHIQIDAGQDSGTGDFFHSSCRGRGEEVRPGWTILVEFSAGEE